MAEGIKIIELHHDYLALDIPGGAHDGECTDTVVTIGSGRRGRQLAQLFASAPDMFEALRAAEDSDFGSCPICKADTSEGDPHTEACVIGKALAKAKGES